eukprot:1448984-Ditylum_brightwellii.AAC.1
MDHLNGTQNLKAKHTLSKEMTMFGAKSTSMMGSTMAFICCLGMIKLPGSRRSRRMLQNKGKVCKMPRQ